MNLGQQMVFPVLAGTIDEATRDRLLAEHLTSNLQNNSFSTALASAGFIPANAFINLSTPGAVVNHTINLLRTPVATLAQTIGLQNTAAVVGHHIGLKAAGVPHPNRLQVPNVGINHTLGLNVPRTPIPHQYITALPGVGINIGPKAPGVNPNMNPAIGSKTPVTPGGVGSSSMNAKAPGTSLTHNLASRVAMTTGTQSMVHRVAGVNMAQSRNGSWQGTTPSAGIQVGPSQANATHLNANISHQRPAVQGVTGYLQHKHKLLGQTYLDEFKQGFPSKGLSFVQNRWWGSAEPRKPVEFLKSTGSSASSELDRKITEAESSKPSVGASQEKGADEKTKEILLSCAKLTRSRKRAAERGRSALQLGLNRGYGVQKLEHQQSKTLKFAFGRLFPKEWSYALPTCD